MPNEPVKPARSVQPYIEPKDAPKVFVSIPQTDLTNFPHCGVTINHVKYEAGKSYKVSEEIGTEINRLLRNKEASDISLLSSAPNLKALLIAAQRGASTATTAVSAFEKA